MQHFQHCNRTMPRRYLFNDIVTNVSIPFQNDTGLKTEPIKIIEESEGRGTPESVSSIKDTSHNLMVTKSNYNDK